MTLEPLIQKLKSGNMVALENIYLLMNKSVYILSYSILADAEKAKDVLQDTFIKVAQSIHSYKANTNAEAWICRIARNLCYTEYSKAKRNISLEVYEGNIADKKNHEELWIQNILLKKALLWLKPLEREIVVLFAIQGYKHREIAQIIKRPMGTVQRIYNKSIKKLRHYMEEQQ